MAKEDAGIKLLKEKLKSNDLTGIYVFTGEEKYAKKMAIDAIRVKFEEYGFSEFNIRMFDEKEATAEAISDYIEAFPVMSEYKLAIIRNSGVFKSTSEEMKKLWQGVIEKFPEYLAVVFDEENIDGRNALVKKMKTAGIYAEFKYKTSAELAIWCEKLFAKENIKAGREVVDHLVFSCDEGMENLKNEAEKLIAYCGDKKEISVAEVDLIVRKSLKNRIFEMLDAISEKRAVRAYEILGELKIYREQPIKILVLLGRQAVMLLKASVLLEENRYGDIASELGLSPFIAKKYAEGARRGTSRDFYNMTEKCAKTDFAIKTGKTEGWTAIEMLIGELLEQK